MLIDKEDYIYLDSWKGLCDYTYDNEVPLTNCIVYVPCDHIDRFFDNCDTGYNYTVVSGESDFCPSYQKDYPVQADLVKWLDYIKWHEEIVGYEDFIIKSRCYKHKCKITDKFSLRSYSFTNATFNRVPENVTWYSVNANINEAIQIPFGIPKWANIKNTEKERLVYVNFQNNTQERLYLKNKYCTELNGVQSLFIEKEISHNGYYNNISRCKYTLCPEGNGFDCYRTLESIYSGAIPIIVNSQSGLWSEVYGKCNCDINDIRLPEYDDIDYEKCKLSYWKKHIRSSIYGENTDFTRTD